MVAMLVVDLVCSYNKTCFANSSLLLLLRYFIFFMFLCRAFVEVKIFPLQHVQGCLWWIDYRIFKGMLNFLLKKKINCQNSCITGTSIYETWTPGQQSPNRDCPGETGTVGIFASLKKKSSYVITVTLKKTSKLPQCVDNNNNNEINVQCFVNNNIPPPPLLKISHFTRAFTGYSPVGNIVIP